MPKLVAVILAALLLALPAAGQDFDKGLEAYGRGDYAAALKEWRPLAEQGDAIAQALLGFMYAEGQGVPQDHAEAVKWYRRAAEQGDV
ncbi:MAG: SEL1-like repeat protein, partial [Alphaproteobacteria bacterium]|nr:SEL1-like repeat protein [Alphaproteobacteria bacterium]